MSAVYYDPALTNTARPQRPIGANWLNRIRRNVRNASIANIKAGLKPVGILRFKTGDLQLFQNGQVRRLIGRGHSHEERAFRRQTQKAFKRALKLQRA